MSHSRRYPIPSLAAFSFLFVVFVARTVSAQEITASITGSVTDASGAVIPAITVTVTNVETGISRDAVTSSTGDYQVPLLRPGPYRVSVQAAGFKTYEQSGIRLEVNQRARVDFVLQVGNAVERVEVTAELPAINTENATVGKVIDHKSITTMPLNGRLNITGLLALAPGIQNAGTQDGVPIFGVNPTVSGASGRMGVSFTLDGVSNSNPLIERGNGEFPPLDGIEEFNVITSGASAEFGRANQVIVVSKSGTNDLHGTLLYFNRNRILAAKNFFATHLPNPQYNRNEFGGNFSGPIHLPRVYGGKNRSFFFFNQETFIRRQAQTRTANVGTAAMRAGDFAGLPAIRDALAGNSPFPANRVPGDRLNPVTRRLGDLYPLPNQPGTGAAGTGNNLIENLSIPEDVNRWSSRVDHSVSSKHQVYGTLMWANLGPNPSNGPVSTFGGFREIGDRNVSSSLGWNHSVSSSAINELRAGYMHLRIYRTPQNDKLNVSGIIPGLGPQYIPGAPQINIQNFTGMSEAGSGDLAQNFEVTDNLSITRGAHSLKLGYTYQHPDSYNIASREPQRGRYDFIGRYSGNGFADFVLGYPSGTTRPDPSVSVRRFRQHRHSGYIQDAWRLNRSVTLNFGLRYELIQLQAHRYGQVAMFVRDLGRVAVFQKSLPASAIPRLVQGFGIRLAQEVNLPADVFEYLGQDTNNFAPRFGIAWKLTAATVLRTGGGVYYNTLPTSTAVGLADQIPFGLVETFEQPGGVAPGFTMSNPFPGGGAIPANPVASTLERTVTPYTAQWNLTLERQVFRYVGLRVGYYGQRNIRQHGSPDINAVRPAPGPVQPRRPFQPYAGINAVNTPMFQSTSNQLQAGIQKRYARGLLLSAEYQWTRVIGTEGFQNPFNWNDSRGSLGGIRRHVLSLSYAYDLPIGKGRAFLSGAKGLAAALASGWQIAGVTQALSGSPFNATFNTNVQGSVGGRPDVVPGARLYPDQRTPAAYFNPAAFARPPEFSFGNAGVSLLWGPGQQNWDFSLGKNHPIGDRANVLVKFEAFSAFNHPQFGNPAANISNTATVGRINSAGGNRTCQIGAKLTF